MSSNIGGWLSSCGVLQDALIKLLALALEISKELCDAIACQLLANLGSKDDTVVCSVHE